MRPGKVFCVIVEKIWNKTKPVTKKLLSLSSDINVVHSCMMYKIRTINNFRVRVLFTSNNQRQL